MSIEQTEEKINPVVEHSSLPGEQDLKGDTILAKIGPFYHLLLVLLVASMFFALGRLSVLEERKGGIKIYNDGVSQELGTPKNTSNTASVINAIQNTPTSDGTVIGSKSGKKYYFPWCGTVKRIKPENQVHFESIESAREAGFTPGGNCKGLE